MATRGKGRATARFNRESGWRTIKATLARNVWSAHSDEGHAKLLLPGYTALTALGAGRLDENGFTTLHVMNATAFCLLSRCAAIGTDAVRNAIPPLMHTVMLAADALTEIGQRYSRLWRFGASGTQLQAVRAAIRILDEYGQGCPIALLLQALEDARSMVDRYLREGTA